MDLQTTLGCPVLHNESRHLATCLQITCRWCINNRRFHEEALHETLCIIICTDYSAFHYLHWLWWPWASILMALSSSKSIKAGRESSGHMDHIFPLNKACYSMLVSLHQFFTKVCLSKHRAHLSTLHTTDSSYQASLWKAADFKIERKWVYECALRIMRALCIKWNLSGQHLMIKTLQTVIWHYHHNPVLIEFYICRYLLFWLIQEEGMFHLMLIRANYNLFSFMCPCKRQVSPIGKGQKKGIERLTISEWKWWLEKASLIFKAQIKNTSIV